MHGLGYTAQELAAHFRGVRELQRQQRGGFARGGQRGFFERGRMETHPFRLWGRHPMAPICTDPSCPMCTDPNYPWYNPNDPVCQAGGLSGLGYTAQELQAHFRNVRRLCASPGIWGNRGFEGLGCMGAVATSAPVIRGTLIKVGGPRPIGRPIPITNPVRIARSPGQHGQSWQHGQERHGQRLPGWGARGLHWNNRRGWARGANRWFPWNVSPVCSDPSSGFYNPEDPSCATGVNPVCSDPSYPGYNPNDPSCGGGTAALTAATSSDASAPTYSGGGHAMPSWIWLAGGALLLVLVMKK